MEYKIWYNLHVKKVKGTAMNQKDFFDPEKGKKITAKFFTANRDFAFREDNFPQAFFDIVALYARDCDYELSSVECMSGVLSIKGGNEEMGYNRLYMNYTARLHDSRSKNPEDPANVTAAQGGADGVKEINYYGDREESIVIDTITFIHQRKGYMDELFEILKRIQKKYRLGPIKMENVLSPAMKAWCEKHGLTMVKDLNEINYYYYGDRQ